MELLLCGRRQKVLIRWWTSIAHAVVDRATQWLTLIETKSTERYPSAIHIWCRDTHWSQVLQVDLKFSCISRCLLTVR